MGLRHPHRIKHIIIRLGKAHKVIFGSKAYNEGLRAGDVVERINGEDVQRLTSSKANHFIRTAGQKLALELHKSFKPSYTIPEIRITEATTESNKPVNNNKNSSSVLHRPFGVSDEKREAEDDDNRRRGRMIAASPSQLALMRKKPPVAAATAAAAAAAAAAGMANGEDGPCPADQASGSNVNIWSPFGKSSVSPLKTYKPVAFSPFSSSTSTSLSSSLSSFSDSPVKSSSTVESSSQQTTAKTATTSIMNGIAPNEISPSAEADGNSRNDSSSTHSSSLLFSPSSKDGRPLVSSSASDWKPTKPSTSAIMWKPPVATAVEVKSSAVHNNAPTSTPSDRIKTVSFASKKNSPSDSDSAAMSSEWKPVQVVTTSSVRVDPPAAETPSEGWKKFQVSDRNCSDGFTKSADQNAKADPIDATIFDRELTEDWWDSLFNEAQKAEAAAEAAALAAENGGGGVGDGAGYHRKDEDVSYSQKTTVATDSEMAPLSSTAAVLRLSSSLGDAIQVATNAELMADSQKQHTAPSTQHNRGPRKPVNNDILDEWRSGFSDNSKNSDQNDYDRLKEFHETRSQSSNHRKVIDDESNSMSERTNGGVSETTDVTTTQQRAMKKVTTMNVNGLIPVKFEGIGPTEEKTGCPIATRVSIDEKNRKDWYRRMYASLNKPHRPPGKQTLLPSGVHMKDQQRVKSPSPPGTSHSSYYPPHAKYNPDRYRNQPLRIEDYEPGYHCSIALKDQKADPNRIFESDAEVDYRSEDLDQFAKELRDDLRNNGLLENRPGSRKKGTSTVNRSKSFNRQTARQKRDEENLKRKQELETVMAEERRRRFTMEQKDSEARRHKDLYTPVQKTTFLLNRFGDDEIGGMTIQRPNKVKAIKMRGKAKALYTFKAQSNRELSFKKTDIIYLLRQLDRNWYQGEHNGIVGIFPIAYVEVITSLEEAKTMALQREGKAIAKFNFKAKTSAELSLQKGDVVRLIRKADQNWYEGRIGNRHGIFPINFVETVQEPDAPMMTPSPSSAAPTPMPETSGHLSPTSSLYSGGPDIPSAPISPWNSDFYESEFEPELRELTSKGQGHRPHSGNKSNSVHHQKMESIAAGRESANPPRQTTYFTFPAQTNAPVVNAAPAALSEKSRKDMRNTHGEKDLFALARKRRATAGSALEARSASLGDDLEKILRPASLEPLGKSLSFDLGPRDNFSKGAKSASSSRYTVIYDYKPKNLDELELKEGDVVCVMEKCDDGWFVGYSETTSEFGTFPGNYVERLF